MLIASALLLATVVPNAQSVGDRVNALVTEFRTILALDRDANRPSGWKRSLRRSKMR